MCISCAKSRLLEAVASSLTELFSPQIIGERMEGMLKNYDFVTAETLAYFSQRPPQAERDARFALDYVKQHARTAEAQQRVLAALEFKCDVLWAMLDALYHAYVAPRQVPPGAFVPQIRSGVNEPAARSPPTRARACRTACGSCTTRPRAAGCCWRRSGCSRPTPSPSRWSNAAPAKRHSPQSSTIWRKPIAAPRERVLADVTALLRGLADKRLLEL